MNITLAIMQKIKRLFLEAANEKDKYAFAMAPFAFPLTNLDFCFLDPADLKSGEDTRKYYMAEREFAILANSISSKPLIWQVDTQALLYDIYKDILDNAQLIDPTSFTSEENAARDAAKALLYGVDGRISKKFKAYKTIQKKFDSIEREIVQHQLDKAKIDPSNKEALSAWEKTDANLKRKESDLKIKWEVVGNRTEIEKAIKLLTSEREMQEFVNNWESVKNVAMNDAQKADTSGVSFLETFCLPNDLYKANSPIWKEVEIEKAEINALENEAKRDLGEILNEVMPEQEAELESITFKICWVDILRPWFNDKLLLSQYWKMPGDEIISAGLDSYEGVLPSYPVKMVMVKDTDFRLSSGSKVNDDLKENLQLGKTVFIGPFLLKNIPVNENLDEVHSVIPQELSTEQMGILGSIGQHGALDLKESDLSKPTVLMNNYLQLQDLRGLTKINELPTDMALTRLDRPILFSDRGGVDDAPISMPEHEELTFTVCGNVMNKKSGSAIDGAEVAILNSSTGLFQSFLTDGEGKYSITALEKGSYHITSKKQGFTVFSADINVDGDTNYEIDLEELATPEESFQLIAVISRKMPKLPDPVKNGVFL